MPKTSIVGPDDLKEVLDDMFGPGAAPRPHNATDTQRVRVALLIGISRIVQAVTVLALAVFFVVGAIRSSFAWWAIVAFAIIAIVAWALKHHYSRTLAIMERAS